MGTTAKDLSFWLLLSGIAHGLVLGALPPLWSARSGAGPQELRVSLGAGVVTGRQTASVPAARSATPSAQPRATDESSADPGAGSASREAQARATPPPVRRGPEPAAQARRPLETARSQSAADEATAAAKGPNADEEQTEVAALRATSSASDGGLAPKGVSSEAPTAGGEAKKVSAAAAAGSAPGAASVKATTVDEETTEVAALTVPPPREAGRRPPETRVSLRENARSPAPDMRERAPDAQATAATEPGVGERPGAGPRAADEGAAASVQAKADAQVVAAAARVSAPAFSRSAGGQVAADELLALLHREISRHKRYPLLARRQQREGKATVRFRLHPDGYVDDVNVVRSSGFRPLDDAAVRAVGDVVPFEPAARFLAGAERFEVDVVFTLR